MADTAAFYRERAAAERANADVATLDNVRERCDRAASSWNAMAVRAERTQTLRATREGLSPALAIPDADESGMIG